jgi:hypothetical protein
MVATNNQEFMWSAQPGMYSWLNDSSTGSLHRISTGSLQRIPNQGLLLWKLQRVNIGKRNVRRQTSDKEIVRLLGF